MKYNLQILKDMAMKEDAQKTLYYIELAEKELKEFQSYLDSETDPRYHFIKEILGKQCVNMTE